MTKPHPDYRSFRNPHYRFVILAGISIFLLLSCSIREQTTPDYVPPRIILDSNVTIYPPEALAEKLEGTVVLLVYVERNGYIGSAGISRSSGHAILDSAALQFARTVRFTPGQIRGRPQDLWMTWPIVFRLSSAPIFSINLIEWQQNVVEFQITATEGNLLKRITAQDNLLAQYVSISKTIVDNRSIIPNRTILDVVDPQVRDMWVEYEEVWPLEFILFQDYINRFPASWHVNRAENHLIDYISQEIAYLGQASMAGSPIALRRYQLLSALNSFLEDNYPYALIQD